MKWFDDETSPPPFLRTLEETRRLATREGWCYQHVQAIIVAIDQYAEAATSNRDFFLNKPYRAKVGDVPQNRSARRITCDNLNHFASVPRKPCVRTCLCKR